MNKDFYGILGLEKNATEKEIKTAYRDMAKKYHPDKNPDNKETEEKFKKIAEAYEVLSNPIKKEKYDQFGSVDSIPNFGYGFNKNSWSNIKVPPIRENIEILIKTTFDDLCQNKKKNIKYVVTHVENEGDVCGTCNGSGNIIEQLRNSGHIFIREYTCNQCGGNGHYYKIREETKEIEITLNPLYIFQPLFIKKSGNEFFKGVYGNLIIYLELSDPNYKMHQFDIYGKKEIPFILFLLGGEYIVNVGDKKFSIKLKNLKSFKKRIKLKGQGLNVGDQKGDLYFDLEPKFPDEITKEEEEIIKNLSNYKNFKQ